MNSTKHIILVEDDIKLSRLISDYLESNGFTVEVINNGAKAMVQLVQAKADLIILDVMLPGTDGFEVCKKIRPHYHGPILFLTAKSSDFDQVLGLEIGADDFIAKPVEPRVLLARINAILRRFAPHETTDNELNNLHFGQLHINQSARTLTLSSQEITLTSHEFDMLLVLASNAGEILSREYLTQVLKGRDYNGLDRSIDVRVSKLRKKLGDNPDNPSRIKTIWGKGYIFVPDAWGN
ncbi:DNA-binding response regulator [Saccharobesus litoralis]|uniref:DNA-binding response regulator n=1 Tax=Saccharobesus litoralis TaxID=2172099 RepID=A0A2S0VXB0_9ALTE|nr:DNA-binding response regulator [Saccharobesus litoralis]